MILVVCTVLVAQSAEFSRTMELVGQGRFREAHGVLEELANPQEAAQAEVFLRLRAGDLPGALRAADRGVSAAPDDLWLHERRAAIALSLGAEERTEAAVEAFEGAALRVDGSATSDESLARMQAAVRQLSAKRAERTSALRRARVTVFGAVVVLVGLMGVLVRKL